MEINYTLSQLKCVANEQIVQKCSEIQKGKFDLEGNYIPYSGELS